MSPPARSPEAGGCQPEAGGFFHAQVCAACHESALEEVAEGSHGGMEKSADRRVEVCIECHDPHYQLSASVKAVPPDLGPPSAVKCRLRHAFQAALPRPGLPDETCLACHHRPGAADPGEAEKTTAFCLSCHGADTAKNDARVQTLYPMLDRARYAATSHARLSCLTGHPDADDFGHGDQRPGDCRRCHAPHDARTADEVHLKVACGACHLNGVTPVKDRVSGGISWTKARSSGISDVHRMSRPTGIRAVGSATSAATDSGPRPPFCRLRASCACPATLQPFPLRPESR